MININSTIQFGNNIGNDFSIEEIKNEPMLFGCDLEHTNKLGGPLTKLFLDNLCGDFLLSPGFIVDSRVHMLMKGWYPSIPGHHHDDVPRERCDDQPEYHNPSYRSKHAMLILGGGSRTEFALGNSDFPDVKLGEKYYKIWHPIVVEMIRDRILLKYDAEFGKIIYFDDRTWHQGTPAYESGWRFFIRASISNRKPSNEIRKQVQVYLENPMEGW